MKTKNILPISNYFKKKNVKRFSLFFVIASVFLIISKLSNDYKQLVSLNIDITNLEEEIIIKEDTSNLLNAYVEAKGFTLLPFLFNNGKSITIDAETELLTKQNEYIFDVRKYQYVIEKQLGKSYRLISIEPDTLRISYSKRVSKKVPVVLRSEIDYATGYDIKGTFKMDKDSVKIVGTSEDLSKINEISTETLTLNEVKNDINESIAIDIGDYNSIDIFPPSVQVKAEVKRFTEGTIEVPVRIVNKPSDLKINFFPKTVKLVYYVDLENYNKVNASDFMVQVNFAEIKPDQTYMTPQCVKKPEFVKRVSITQKRIDFIKL